jgi:hypothetical protein
MGSAARRRGAYGGEYMRAGLHLRARGGRKEAKGSQTGLEKTTGETARWLKTIFGIRSNLMSPPFSSFYRRPQTCLCVEAKLASRRLSDRSHRSPTWSDHSWRIPSDARPVSHGRPSDGRACR